jgi:hypothetical protein
MNRDAWRWELDMPCALMGDMPLASPGWRESGQSGARSESAPVFSHSPWVVLGAWPQR